MKKVFSIWFSIVLIALCMGFSSCSKDENVSNGGNNNPENLIGHWYYQKGGSWSLGDAHIGKGYPDNSQIIFKKDGTYEASDSNPYNDWDYYGTWSVKGDKLTVLQSYYNFNGARKDVSETINRSFSIKGDTLRLRFYPPSSINDTFDVYYTRDEN